MTRLILSLVALVLLAVPVFSAAQAAAITVRVTVDGVNTDLTLNARQVGLMNRRLADFNDARTANGQATVTMGVFLRGIIVPALRGEEVQAESHEQAEACATYLAKTAAQRATIDAGFGGKSPCR